MCAYDESYDDLDEEEILDLFECETTTEEDPDECPYCSRGCNYCLMLDY